MPRCRSVFQHNFHGANHSCMVVESAKSIFHPITARLLLSHPPMDKTGLQESECGSARCSVLIRLSLPLDEQYWALLCVFFCTNIVVRGINGSILNIAIQTHGFSVAIIRKWLPLQPTAVCSHSGRSYPANDSMAMRYLLRMGLAAAIGTVALVLLVVTATSLEFVSYR
jgi:hypothetical protein